MELPQKVGQKTLGGKFIQELLFCYYLKQPYKKHVSIGCCKPLY